MIKLLFVVSIIAIPFNDIYPLLPLGELKNEMSAYLFLVTMGVVLFRGLMTQKRPPSEAILMEAIPQPFAKMAIAMAVVVGISFVMNFFSIFGPPYRGRYPLEKFMTSSAVMIYGYSIAYMTYILSRKHDWHQLIMWPVGISIGICSVVAIIEVLAWFNSGFEGLYNSMSQLIHMGTESQALADGLLLVGRARSICFEPPWLANFAGLAWPWTYAGMLSASRKSKPIYVVLWLLCTALVMVANSRTSWVLLFGNIVILLLLKFVYLPTRPIGQGLRQVTSFFVVACILIAILAISSNLDTLVSYIIKSDSVSNLTRFSSFMAAFRMFLQSPLWGYGLGQFGFHMLENLPPWAYYSWEVNLYYDVDPFQVWPPVYSVFARFAAELGILGVVVWIGVWVLLARAVWRVTFAYQLRTGKLLTMSYPIIMGCYSALLVGIALDSMRTPMMWISMGLACGYIYDVRSRLARIQQGATDFPTSP